MACNKYDARLAKQEAEQMFSSHDFAGAKRVLSEAKNFDGMEQMLAIVDVHMAAELRIAGNEMDFYAILHVDPSADDNTIKEHYRKLALTLHPDRNKEIGAETAFRLIGEALGTLSDKCKRAQYDMKRITFWTVCPSCKSRYHFPRMYENCKLQCQSCRLGFVAKDISIDGIDTCTQSYANVGVRRGSQQPCAQNGNGFVNGSAYNITGQVQVPTHGTAGYATASSNAEFVSHVDMNKQADKACKDADQLEKESYGEEIKREQDGQKKTKVKEKRREAELKQRKANPKTSESSRKRLKRSDNWKDENDVEEHIEERLSTEITFSAQQPRRSSRVRRDVDYKPYLFDLGEYPAKKKSEVDTKPGMASNANASSCMEDSDNRKRMVAERDVEMANIGVPRGKSSSDEKVQDVPLKSEVKSESDNKSDEDDDDDEEYDDTDVVEVSDDDKDDVVNIDESDDYDNDDRNDTFSDTSEEELAVPDADFHDFDADRLEESIKEGQIWATYEEHDGMPRYYCQITNIVSVKPFRVRIKWLESCLSTHTRRWKNFFPLPFGDFVLSHSSRQMEQISVFSHMMEPMEGALKVIYPQQGQVWALYRDWMPDWCFLTKKEVRKRKRKHKYEMVLVVTGFSEEEGLDFISLQKIYGYVSVFQESNAGMKHISSEEIFRFSHRIPAHQLKGDEAPNIPKRCWELDPAALPA